MSTQVLYLSQIRTVLKNVEIESIGASGGQYNDVLVINNEWIFRFPRYRDGVTRLIAETRLLEALQGFLPLPIPRPVYQRLDPPVPGLAFTGYKRLPGEGLLAEAVRKINADTVLDRIAGQLAEFLRMLHAMPLYALPVELAGGSAQAQDRREQWEQMYFEVREKLFAAMRPDARRTISDHFETYLDDRALQQFDPALRHGDFGGSNILWDPAMGTITGVIDFSSCAPGDPAYDLASIATVGDDLFARLAARYQPDAGKREAILARARFYRGTFALVETLEGLRYNDRAAYERGMEGLV